MPMMRDTPPPLPADVVRELRSTLASTYGHKLVNHEGKMVLAVRVPAAVPDRERDVLHAADAVPEDDISQARDVLFIGEEKLIRLDPIPLRDAIREKIRDEVPISKEVRRGLAREYGASLFNPASRRDWCIAVRLPRASYRDCTTDDVTAIQKALEPVLAQPKASQAGMCYLVADNDYRRCTPDEFARMLRGEVTLRAPKMNNYAIAGDTKSSKARAAAGSFSGSPFGLLVSSTIDMDAKMEKNKQAKAAPATQASTAPPPPPAPPQPLAPQATSLMQLASLPPTLTPMSTPTPAAPSAPIATETASIADPITALGAKFTQAGFEVLTEVADLGIHLAAHKADGKRIIVLRTGTATPEAVQALAGKCKELEADAGVLVADAFGPGTWLQAAGTPVTLLPSSQADAWAL